jgi:ATP-binding cassette subfamily B protein
MELRKFIPYYKPHLKLLTFDLWCAFLVAGLDLLFPIISKYCIDVFIPNGQISLIFIFTGILFLLYVIRMFATYFMGYWGHVMGTRIEKDVRSDLFRHIQTLPFSYFDENKTGQILSRFTHDLREIGEMAHHGPEDLFISSLMIVGSMVILLLINPLLTLIMFCVVLCLVLFVITRRKATMDSFRDVKASHAEINARLETSISGIRLCKTFTNESLEIGMFEDRNQNYALSWNKAYKALAHFVSGNNFFTEILGVIAIGLGGYFVATGKMSLGDLVAYLLYAAMFTTPIRRLIQFTQQYIDGATGFDRFQDIMQIEPEITDTPDAIHLKNPLGKIEFKDVEFRYKTKNSSLFSRFNLLIEPGQSVGLVGPSGVGKTTLTHLIPRFYEVTNGEILIDGINIRKFTQQSLRENIGFVQQDVIIFWGTIKENIIYGRPDATDDEVIEAAKNANIHDFIMSLPQGYNSLVGERGVKLSGGEKQRISIARIFLKNPPILILDEATSSLDNITEVIVQEALIRLAQGRTTIIIAHRLSTLKHVKEILVLNDGGIQERGSHEQLLEKNGIYATFYNAQYLGFNPNSPS